MQALGHLPDRPDLLPLEIDLQFDLRNALWPLAEFRRVFECLKHAERLATTLGDQKRLAMTFALLTPMFSTREERSQGIEYGRRALDLGAALGDTIVQVVATLYLAMAYLTLGNYTRATKFARKNVDLLQGEVRLERFGPHGLHAEPAIRLAADLESRGRSRTLEGIETVEAELERTIAALRREMESFVGVEVAIER